MRSFTPTVVYISSELRSTVEQKHLTTKIEEKILKIFSQALPLPKVKMDLKLKEVAELLKVSTTTIRRWLQEGSLPAYRINNQYRFSRAEIDDWVLRQRLPTKSDQLSPPTASKGLQRFVLYRALHRGGIHRMIAGSTKEELFRNAMEEIAIKLGLDADGVTSLLLDRERMMPTALNHGIAVPHTRDCLVGNHQDFVFLVFPEQPIEYGALDREKVHSLFFLFSSSDHNHLELLAKIALLASQKKTEELLLLKPDNLAIFSYLKEWENGI